MQNALGTSILPHASSIPSQPATVPQDIQDILSVNPDGTRDLFREKFASGSGMPKKDVADYVESQGVLVPRRFENFQVAVDSGAPFIVRSEDPREYAGKSGIYSSHVFERDIKEIDKFVPFIMFFREITQSIELYQTNSTCNEYTVGYDSYEITLSQETMSKCTEGTWIKRISMMMFEKLCSGELDVSRELKVSIKDRSNIDEAMNAGKAHIDIEYVDLADYVLPPGWSIEQLYDVFYDRSDIDQIQVFYEQKFDRGVKSELLGNIDEVGLNWEGIKSRLIQHESKKYNREISNLDYSFWEYVPGDNIAICRDNTQPDIYYVYISEKEPSYVSRLSNIASYSCNRVDINNCSEVMCEYIRVYERVVNLPVFDKKNCPIMELQKSEDGKIYFLQSLPTQSIEEGWLLDRDPELDEIEVGFVRGSTPSEGIVVQVANYDDIETQTQLPVSEKGFSISTSGLKRKIWDRVKNTDFLESATEFAQLGVITFDDTSTSRYDTHHGFRMMEWVIGDHGGRSLVHKPKISLFIGSSHYTRLGITDGNPARIRVISDGKKCYIKKLF